MEVCNNNQWGTVCEDTWNSLDASVACFHLGYSKEGIIKIYILKILRNQHCLQGRLAKGQPDTDKELDPYYWIKFTVMEMSPAYLIVLKTLLDNMTVSTLKMQVSHALQVKVLLVIQVLAM